MTENDEQTPSQAPAVARSERSGSLWMLIVLALALGAAAAGIAFLPRDQAEPYVLALLGVLAVIGVFSLFAGAIGLLRLSGWKKEISMSSQFMDSMAEGVLVTDPSGRIVYANQAYAELTGAADAGEVSTIGRVFASDPNATESVFRLSQAGREGRRAQEEIRLTRPIAGSDSAPRWYRVRVRPLSLADEDTKKASDLTVWHVADVTGDRDEQENSFQELQRAINFLDHAPAGFLSCDGGGQVSYLNATLADWLGLDLTRFESGSMALEEIVPGDGAALIQAVSGKPGEVVTETIDIDFVKKSGQSLPVRLIHRVPISPDGAKGDSRTLVLNRSGEQDGADALQAAEVRFSRFFNNTPFAIASIDKDGMIGRTNAPFVRMFGDVGHGDGEAKNLPLTDVVAEQNREQLASAIAMAASDQVEVPTVDATFAGNDHRHVRFYVSAVTEDSGSDDAAIVYALDTTEQRELEGQFAQSQKMQAIGQLAGGVAHDFNNVLTAIIGFSDLLLANHRPTDPSFQDIMNIKQNANRAAGLVRQLLAFSRRQTLRPQELELNSVMAELRNLLNRLVDETVELTMIYGRDLWPVMADINQFETVIVNLVVNARDAMPDGGKVTIETKNIGEEDAGVLEAFKIPPADFVEIDVTDTGTGMSAEIMEKIFDPFYSTKDVGKGTGLGLSTVYGIIKQSGGYVFAESELGSGTTFRIFLPRHYVEVTEAEPEVAEKAPDMVDLTGTATILLVEDEEAVRAFASRALSSRGYTVHAASTGTEALAIMAENDGAIDLVVSDVVMPEMDGPTLLGELRKLRPDLKIIFVSGYAEDAFAKNLPENEAFNFLPKPFSLKQLATAVKDALGS